MKPFERTLLIVIALCGVVLAAGAVARPLSASSTDAPIAEDEAKIAMCDVYEVMEKLMNSERYKPLIEEKDQSLFAELQPLGDQLNELRSQLQGANPEDAGAQETFRRYQTLSQQYGRLQQQKQAEFQQFVAQQLASAFELARTSAEGIAKEMGYTHLLNSRDVTKPIDVQGMTPDRVAEAVLSRSVLMIPEADNITQDVLKELNVEDVVVEKAGDADEK